MRHVGRHRATGMAEFCPTLENRDGVLRAEVVQMPELIPTAVEIDEHAFHHDAPLSAGFATHRTLAASRGGATSVQEHTQFPQQLPQPSSVARATSRRSVTSLESSAVEHPDDSFACLAPPRVSSYQKRPSFSWPERSA